MNAYEVTLKVDGKVVIRTEWAENALDAVVMGTTNAGAIAGHHRVRVVHLGPRQEDVLRAQTQLERQIDEATRTATSSARRGRP